MFYDIATKDFSIKGVILENPSCCKCGRAASVRSNLSPTSLGSLASRLSSRVLGEVRGKNSYPIIHIFDTIVLQSTCVKHRLRIILLRFNRVFPYNSNRDRFHLHPKILLEPPSIESVTMTAIALSSPLGQDHREALSLSQQTTQYLQRYSSSKLPVPIPFLSSPESVELWASYEKLLLSCLRTGDDKSAHECLEKLIQRFGATNERVMGLRGLYQEAVADDDAALEKILHEYNEVLDGDSVNTVRSCARRVLSVDMGADGGDSPS